MSDELTELVDAEIFVEGAENPSDEQRLLKSIEGIKGVAELALAQGRLDVRYDPISITKSDLIELIKGAGFSVKEVESAAASPLTDTIPMGQPPASV